jgi:hypothetical protein
MMMKPMSCTTLCLFVAVCFFGASAVEAGSLVYVGVAEDQTDYSATGLNIGKDGYWFANFGQANNEAQVEDDDPFAGAVDALPSWFSPMAFNDAGTGINGAMDSIGGVPSYNELTLPDGTIGRSGQVLDNAAPATGNNVVDQIIMGVGVPANFLVHIVVDNDDGAHTLERVRYKVDNSNGDERADFDNGRLQPFNQTADVYTFQLLDWPGGTDFKIQLRGDTTVEPFGTFSGFAGIMIDVIPEPSSAMLLTLGAIGLGTVGGRRRGSWRKKLEF